jgi:hypothetical protein
MVTIDQTVGRSTQVRIASGINTLLGVWLIISPLVFFYALDNLLSLWSSVIAGALISIFGIWRSRSPGENATLSWANIVLGGWVALSPWVFGNMSGPAFWNNLIVGLCVVVLAIWSGSATVADRRDAHA